MRGQTACVTAKLCRYSHTGSWISETLNTITLALSCSAVLLAGLSLSSAAEDSAPLKATPATRQHTLDAYSRLPLSFERNQGQTADQVDFVSRGPGYTLFLTKTEAVLSLQKPTENGKPAAKTSTALRLQFEGANRQAEVSGIEELPGKSNYFIGNNSALWRTNIATFGKVQYHDVYRGIDLLYYGNQHQLEYDLVLAPGADTNQIAFHFQKDHISTSAVRSQSISLRADADGNIVNANQAGEVLLRKPTVYQTRPNLTGTAEKQMIDAKYILKARNQVGIQLGEYDKTQALVIDPIPFYSTYLGGENNDYGYAIAVDNNGNAYITGSTASLRFPVPGCVFQCAFAGGLADAFVTELNPGGLPVYSTYLGGAGNDYGYGIAVDRVGDAYVTGSTTSLNFPVAACIQCVIAGATDAFVTELRPFGAGLVYSTYLGGKGSDFGRAIALDPAGDAYVTGYTNSNNFPIAACLQCILGGGNDAFVTEIGPGGGPFVFSTYLGGANNDYAYGIAVNANNQVFVTGSTLSLNFPTTPAACFQCVPQGLSDAFVTHIAAFGAGLINSTYLGGAGNDYAYAIALDAQNNVYVTGSTSSVPFPTVGCFGFSCIYGGGPSDAFVTKLDPGLVGIFYSTYLGGIGADVGRGIAVDAAQEADVTGYTASKNFPVAACFQCIIGGGTDAFVTSLTPPGNALNFSTFLGGKGTDRGYGIAVNLNFNPFDLFVTGSSTSINFPIKPGCFQCALGGLSDAFVVALP